MNSYLRLKTGKVIVLDQVYYFIIEGCQPVCWQINIPLWVLLMVLEPLYIELFHIQIVRKSHLKLSELISNRYI